MRTGIQENLSVNLDDGKPLSWRSQRIRWAIGR